MLTVVFAGLLLEMPCHCDRLIVSQRFSLGPFTFFCSSHSSVGLQGSVSEYEQVNLRLRTTSHAGTADMLTTFQNNEKPCMVDDTKIT